MDAKHIYNIYNTATVMSFFRKILLKINRSQGVFFLFTTGDSSLWNINERPRRAVFARQSSRTRPRRFLRDAGESDKDEEIATTRWHVAEAGALRSGTCFFTATAVVLQSRAAGFYAGGRTKAISHGVPYSREYTGYFRSLKTIVF